MIGDRETVRLVDDAGTPAELRDMLDAAVADEPSVAASARMMAKLDAIAAGNVAASTTAAGAAKWILIVLAGAVGISAGVYGLATRTGASDETDSPALSTATTVSRESPPVMVEPLPPEHTGEPSPASEPAPELKRAPEALSGEPAARPVTRRTKAGAPAPRQPSSEIAIIRDARAAVRAARYRSALSRAKQHASLYADGILAEEREAIAVEALAGLDRGVGARARLERFLRTYPASSYRQRLLELVRSLPE